MSKSWGMKAVTRIVKAGGYVARLFLAVMIGLVSINFSPATAKAETNPVDLELGGAGASSWDIPNIEPGNSGTKVVELRNVGSRTGFVTIWLSDVISNEGVNPEAETGDTAEPGELTDYLMLGLSSNRTSTNLKLPITINKLPQSVSAPKYLEIIPLKSGATANLQWQWSLPAQTGNDVQGDNISFTINYLLREFETTDVSGTVTPTGVFTENVTVAPAGTKGKIAINKGTTGKTKEDQPLSEIWLIEVGKNPSTTLRNKTTIGYHYEAGPEGTTFDQPITITLSYDPVDIPERASEDDLVIATWDEDADDWVEFEDSIVNKSNRTVSVQVTHFSRYTITAPAPPPPPSSRGFIPPGPPRKKEQPPPTTGEKKPATAVLETDMLGRERKVGIEADGTLSQLLTMSDPDSKFVIEVDAGSKITDSDGIPLTRIELTLVEESITVPEDIVILSPTYELNGYINELESSRINFNPPARLTISYNPRNLPENTFLPFIVSYTDEQGLVRLEPPPGSLVEIGKAKAEISHASLFAVAAELAPLPPPLPARFEVSNLIINPGQPQPGQPIIISLTIANEGATAGSLELHLIIDGIVRTVKEISLAGNSSETLTFEVSDLAVGKHRVKIAGLTEQFRIVSTTTPPGELRVNWLVLDISVGVALAVGALVLYLVMRRSRQAESGGIEAV
ncbi:hypothetical protein ACFLWS_00725 [Chloroflexota bacterium]